jgi:acyl-CoA synthetase (AMP-forming)/AMP-acid ligase II/thioesterase domain-containing protein
LLRVPEAAATIAGAVARWADSDGARPALVDVGSRTISFSGLRAALSRFADELGAAGLKREDRVGLLVPAGVAGAQLVVGLASNVTLVPLDPRLTPDELVDLVRVNNLAAIVIPQWIDAPARSVIEKEAIVVLEAAVREASAEVGLTGFETVHGAARALRPPTPADVALLLRSSGTTGAPKLIPVTHGNLIAMAERLASVRWFRLGAEDRVTCTLPLYYAAGIKTSLLVPLILGQTVGFPPPEKALEISEWVDVLRPTYLSVAPAQLNAMIDRTRVSGRRFDGSSLRFVMCAASYLPEKVRIAAESLLRAPILEFYGLSEAGVMAANPVPPQKAKPGTVGVPAAGELLVVDEDRRPLPDGALGQIMICGPTVTSGYIGSPDADGCELERGWLLTGDLGRIDEDGYLTIVGRVKEVINRGGEKIFPYEIEKALLRHPAVLEAAAFGVPHPRLGETISAAAVLKPGCEASDQELKDFLARSLAPFKLPRTVHRVERLPRGKTGKVLRGALSAAYAHRRRDIVPPHHPLEFELRDIWQRLLGTDDFGIDDDFLDKGGDSLLATEMLLEVERLTGKPYPQSALPTLTIRRIHEVVRSGLAGEREVMTQVKGGHGVPLFFCHGDFLTRGIYAQQLAALLPDEHPVFLLHCYANGSIGSSIEEMAESYVREIMRVAPGSPVAVGGFCNGGLAAWHLAHLLRQRGVEVVALLMVDSLSLNARPGMRALARCFAIAGAMVPGAMGTFLRDKAMAVAWDRRRGFLPTMVLVRTAGSRLAAALRGKPPPQPERDASEAATRTYLRMMARYVPRRIGAPVTCFVAAHGRRSDTDPDRWRALAPVVTQVTVPGTHHSMIISERPALATALGRALQHATNAPISLAVGNDRRLVNPGVHA